MRTLDVSKIRDAVRDLCIGANLQLPGDLCGLIEKSTQTETDLLGKASATCAKTSRRRKS